MNIETPFTEGQPGYDWLDGFLKRNPDVVPRKTEHLDRAVFRPVKAKWQSLLVKHARTHNGPVSKKDFAAKLKVLFEESFGRDTVKAGFSSTGLCPFNPSAIVLPERPQVGSITSASTSDDHQRSGFMLQTSTSSPLRPLPQTSTSTSSSPFPQTTSSPLPLTPTHCPLLQPSTSGHQPSTSGHQLQHSTGYQTMGAVSSPSPVLSLGLKDFFLKQLQPRFSMSTGRSARVQRFRYGESLTSEESLKRAREAAEAKEAATTRGKGEGKGKGRGKQTQREESPCNSNRSRSPVSSDNEECKRCGQSGGNNWIQCDICDSWYHTRCENITATLEELEEMEWLCSFCTQ
ncbi:unnamed protein product [Acanthosepion pharaonis]|uniref:PHD-type domain-containing protein n=1 Tax=Acanthosepion pharaonis TaxID=158019 RepID=A0A812CIG0_ACAPH|nr:unnamed protein product [Sepia pharaonis]